jgi:hypothetical protein
MQSKGGHEIAAGALGDAEASASMSLEISGQSLSRFHRLIELYQTIKELTRTSARQEFRAIARLVRQSERVPT